MFKVNVSSINDFANCRFRWWARWIMNRVPREESPALNFGSLLHFIFEKYFEGDFMKDAIEAGRIVWKEAILTSPDPYERDVRIKALAKLEEMEEALVQWMDMYLFSNPCLEVEEPFELVDKYDPDIIYIGRPDRVGIMDDMIWHVQTKTVAPSINFGIFIDLSLRSYHEHLYAEALSKKYSELSYGGTLFNLIRKLKYRTKVTAKKPLGEVKELSEMFLQHPMSINLNSQLHTHVIQCIHGHAVEMRKQMWDYTDTGKWPLPNEKMNGGYYGNKPDAYFRVLTGEISLDNNNYFKDRVDTYSAVDAEEE